MRKLLSTQALFTGAIAILALLVFNLTGPGLQSDLLVSFNQWYDSSGSALAVADPSTLGSRKLSVTVTVTGRPAAPSSKSWTLPARSLTEGPDRDSTARVLQLIRESGVFGLRPLRNAAGDTPSVSIAVRDGEKLFETTVAARDVDRNIQLQNLLKLLDVMSISGGEPAIQPERT